MTMLAFSGVFNAVSESDLIALIPGQLAQRIAPKLGLDIYTVAKPIDLVLITMIWHRRSSSNLAHRWLRELIAKSFCP